MGAAERLRLAGPGLRPLTAGHDHASWLAAHFGTSELRLPGGHLLQAWRGDVFRALARLLGSLGLTRARTPNGL